MADLIAKIVVIGTIVAGVVAVTASGGDTAAPLPAGGYAADVEDGIVSLWVDDAGEIVVSGDHAAVRLSYDDDGNVLDQYDVVTADGTWQVDIDTSREDVYLVTVTSPEDTATTTEREIADESDQTTMTDRVNGVARVIQHGVDGLQGSARDAIDRARDAVRTEG